MFKKPSPAGIYSVYSASQLGQEAATRSLPGCQVAGLPSPGMTFELRRQTSAPPKYTCIAQDSHSKQTYQADLWNYNETRTMKSPLQKPDPFPALGIGIMRMLGLWAHNVTQRVTLNICLHQSTWPNEPLHNALVLALLLDHFSSALCTKRHKALCPWQRLNDKAIWLISNQASQSGSFYFFQMTSILTRRR